MNHALLVSSLQLFDECSSPMCLAPRAGSFYQLIGDNDWAVGTWIYAAQLLTGDPPSSRCSLGEMRTVDQPSALRIA